MLRVYQVKELHSLRVYAMQDKKPVRASLSAVTVVGPSRVVRGSSLGDCVFVRVSLVSCRVSL